MATPASSAPPTLTGPVGPIEIMARGLDLNASASRDVRRVAIMMGLLTLAAAGPIVAITLLAGRLTYLPLFDGSQVDVGAAQAMNAVRGVAELSMWIGLACLIALAVDGQLLALHVIASRATGRPFVLRPALTLVRLRFWRLARANLLVGVILILPRAYLEKVVAPRGITLESQFVIQTLLDVALSIPFAYIATWILLGQVGARQAVAGSWRLVRARPSLAIVIAIVNVAFQTIALFALGAGADLLGQIVNALGLDHASGLGLIPLGMVIGLAITAGGLLVVTVAGLSVGPQVVAFLRLTGRDGGLVAVHDPDNPFATPRVEPLVTRQMKAALAIEAVMAVIVVSQLA